MSKVLTVVLAATLLVACGGEKTQVIDDANMEASGAQAGEESSELGMMATDATETELQGQVQVLGSVFQGLVGQHQAYAATTGSAARVSDLAMRTMADPVFDWDGGRMRILWEIDESGIDLSYDLDITFGESADGGQVLDGYYDFSYGIAAGIAATEYDVQVVYTALTTDAAGCAVSGELDVSYSFELGGVLGSIPGVGAAASSQSGRVKVIYAGCDNVTIEGS
jgi:hypothetical protein